MIRIVSLVYAAKPPVPAHLLGHSERSMGHEILRDSLTNNRIVGDINGVSGRGQHIDGNQQEEEIDGNFPGQLRINGIASR
jgi:hypothetical protein